MTKRERMYATTATSVEAQFFRVNDRGINPLLSVKVVGADRALPEVMEKAEHDSTVFLAIMQKMNEMQGTGKEMAELRETVKAQGEQITALLDALGEKPKGTAVKGALLSVTPDGKNITFKGPDGKIVKSKVSGSPSEP